jgi:hypothetical protein
MTCTTADRQHLLRRPPHAGLRQCRGARARCTAGLPAGARPGWPLLRGAARQRAQRSTASAGAYRVVVGSAYAALVDPDANASAGRAWGAPSARHACALPRGLCRLARLDPRGEEVEQSCGRDWAGGEMAKGCDRFVE